MQGNFSELQNESSAAGKLNESNRRRQLFAVMLFILLFGASLSVKAQQNYIVDRNDDNAVTICDPFTPNDCTLRGAIQRANTDGEASQIQLTIPTNFSQTIVVAFGSLSIANNQSLLITSDPIIISSNGRVTIDGGTSLRPFSVSPGANVTFRNISIEKGGFTALNDGAAIDNAGGTVTIDKCLFLNNVSTDDAGAVKNAGGGSTMTITNSEFRTNTATARGGAIYNEGTMTISNSLFRGNVANTDGGAISNAGSLTVNNSTFSGNSAKAFGGALDAPGGTINLNSVTIAFNVADSDSNSTGGGGGISQVQSSGIVVNAVNTIIAKNTANNGASPDFQNTLTSQGFNLIGNTNGTTINGSTAGNQLNIDPLILPLANDGGTSLTHTLAANSPAIDKGNSNLTTDQRGANFARPFNFPGISNQAGGNGADIGAFERQPSDTPNFDFDGDFKSDLAVFRPSNGAWYLQQSSNGFAGLQFGISTDKIAPADYDGDGKTDVAVYRVGTWYLNRSSLGFTGIQFGTAEDIPVPADFDGDGLADIAVYRPSNSTWYLNRSQLGFTGVQFGQSGDKPFAADFDGDLKADLAVFRPSNGVWYLQRSLLGFTGIQFGISSDTPAAADYDGDGRADVAVFRPSNGTWYLNRSTAGFTGIPFGVSTDLPVAADYDGDSKADVAVFRSNTWYLNRSTAGFTGIQFGANGDTPASGAFVP